MTPQDRGVKRIVSDPAPLAFALIPAQGRATWRRTPADVAGEESGYGTLLEL